jgi:tight adherence protein B
MYLELLILLAIAGGVVVTGLILLAGLMYRLVAGGDLSERLATFAVVPDPTPKYTGNRMRTRVNRLRLRLNSMLSVFSSDAVNLRLLSASWPITETEYLLIRVWGTVGGLVIGWLTFRSVYPGLGLAVIAFLIPPIILNWSVTRRRLKFEKQLIDVLVLVTGAVRSGYSFLQALDVVIQEMKPPVSDEFRRVRREVGLGLPLAQALVNLHTRMQNDDLYLVITAVNINSQVGGNLATMLEVVTNTIRERMRLFGEIRALTSQQRYSGYLLTLLPFIVTAILFIISPDYISRLFQPGLIVLIPITALILVILGNISIRMLGKVEL